VNAQSNRSAEYCMLILDVEVHVWCSVSAAGIIGHIFETTDSLHYVTHILIPFLSTSMIVTETVCFLSRTVQQLTSKNFVRCLGGCFWLQS
jgi:hypothetical protein